MTATNRAIGVSLNVFAAIGAAVLVVRGYRPWYIWLILVSTLGMLWGFCAMRRAERARLAESAPGTHSRT